MFSRRKLKSGNYVILLKPSTYYPDVLREDLGKVVDDYWLRDDILLVDFLFGDSYVNINISPRDLKRIEGRDIQKGKLPKGANVERVLRQYVGLRARSLV